MQADLIYHGKLNHSYRYIVIYCRIDIILRSVRQDKHTVKILRFTLFEFGRFEALYIFFMYLVTKAMNMKYNDKILYNFD